MRIRFKKPRINARNIISFIVIILILIAIGVYAYLQKTGKLSEIKPQLLSEQKLSFFSETTTPTEKTSLNNENPEESELSITATPEGIIFQENVPVITSQGKVYKEIAEVGEGITHLARKALKQYLEEKGSDLDLTPEHKIFIEDYIQNHIGDRWLNLGEEITISEDLIVEAINQSRNLTTQQLENLKQYSALVSFN